MRGKAAGRGSATRGMSARIDVGSGGMLDIFGRGTAAGCTRRSPDGGIDDGVLRGGASDVGRESSRRRRGTCAALVRVVVPVVP